MDSSFIDEIEIVLCGVACDSYNSWPEYWEDVAVYKERIRTILTEWEELCKSKSDS